jgi:hypothetical protein
MNTLSWLILFGGFVDRLSGSITALIFITAIGTIVSTIIYLIAIGGNNEDYSYRRDLYKYLDKEEAAALYNKRMETVYTPWRKRNKMGAILFLVFLGIFTITPSKRDITLVAASEIGERVIKSDTVNKLVDPSVEYLNEWIKAELSNLKENRSNGIGKK